MGHWTSSSAGPASVDLDPEGSRDQPIALLSDDETDSVQITRVNKPAVQVLSDSDEEMVQIDLCSDEEEMMEADQKPSPPAAAAENKSENAENLGQMSPNKKDPESGHAIDDRTESESYPMEMESFEPDNVDDDAGNEPIDDTQATDYQDETSHSREPEQLNNSSRVPSPSKLTPTGSVAASPIPIRAADQAGSPGKNITVAKPPSPRVSLVDSGSLNSANVQHASQRSAAASETEASLSPGTSTKPITSEMNESADLSSDPEHEPSSVSDDDVAQSKQSPESVDGLDEFKSDRSGRESPITLRRSLLDRQPDLTALSSWAMVSEDDEDSEEDESVPIDEASPCLSESTDNPPAGPLDEADGSTASSSEKGQQVPGSAHTSRSKNPFFRACALPELPNVGGAAHESANTDARRLTLTGMLSGLKASHLAHAANESHSNRGSLRTAAAGGDAAVQNDSTLFPTESSPGVDADMQMSDRNQISEALPVIDDRAGHSTRLDASSSSMRNRSASSSSGSPEDESGEDVLMLKSDSAVSPSLSSTLPSGMPDTESAYDNFDAIRVNSGPRRARGKRSPKLKTGETSSESDSTSPDRDNDANDIWTWRQDAHLREAFRPIDDDSIFGGFLSKMDPIVLRDLALSHIEGKTLQQALARARKLKLL